MKLRDLKQEYHGNRPSTRATPELSQRDAKAKAEAWDQGDEAERNQLGLFS